MKELALYIEQAGEMGRIPFVQRQVFGKGDKGEPDKGIFIATGEFGRVIYSEFRADFVSFRLIRLVLNKEILLSYIVETGTIFLNFCIQGIFRFQVNGAKDCLLAASQGKINYGERTEVSAFAVGPTENREYLLLNMTNYPDFSSGELSIRTSPYLINLIKLIRSSISNIDVFTSSIDLRKNVMGIMNELREVNPDKVKLDAYVLLILLAARDYSEARTFPETIQKEWNPEERLVFLLAESIILGMDESWSIGKLANSKLLSRNKVKILFKKYIGMPATTFKISVRMKKAQQLLIDTQLSIQDISLQVGYPNPAHFSSLFKRKIGCSPSNIRKSKEYSKKTLQRE